MNKKNKFKSKPILIKDWANKDQNHKKKIIKFKQNEFSTNGNYRYKEHYGCPERKISMLDLEIINGHTRLNDLVAVGL